MDEKTLTKHPQGKRGVNISKAKCDIVREAITSILRGKQLSHNELLEAVHKELGSKFEGSIDWYTESVKLDLEANKVIERTDEKPQRYRLVH